jgi:hypothetical protein
MYKCNSMNGNTSGDAMRSAAFTDHDVDNALYHSSLTEI